MDFKSKLKAEAKKAILKEATDKILPMDTPAPKLGKKAKLAAIFGTVGAILAAAAQYFGG